MKFLVSHFYTRFPLPTIISPHSLDSTRSWGDGDDLQCVAAQFFKHHLSLSPVIPDQENRPRDSRMIILQL
jgi:hypothetical protein